MAKETFYFSHDYGSRKDPKLVKLQINHGLCGIGLYWCLVEIMYEQGGYLILSEIETYAFELRSDSESINELVMEYGLFQNDGKVFWSDTILDRLKKRQEKSKKASESANKRWANEEVNANALRTQSDGNAIKERKVKKNKVKNKGDAEVKPTSAYVLCMDVYNEFCLEQLGVSAKIDGAQGNALKSIVKYLERNVKEQPATPESVADAFKFVLKCRDRWDAFHRDQLKLTQINSNFVNIINSIKNGHSKPVGGSDFDASISGLQELGFMQLD